MRQLDDEQEFIITIRNLPRLCQTRHVHDAFSLHGNIVRIDMENTVPHPQAWVVFQPPPRTPIPSRIPIANGGFVKWEQHRHSRRTTSLPTTSNRRHPEQIIMLADSITFGPRSSDRSMIAMRTIDQAQGIQVILDMERKVLDIKFPISLNNQIRQFMLRIALSRLSYIHKTADEGKNQTCLIIPFDTAPLFYVKKDGGGKFSNEKMHTRFVARERAWNDWNTWVRVTNIAAEPGDGQVRPLMSHSDNTIIDIGRWTCYKLCFTRDYVYTPPFGEFSVAMLDCGVDIRETEYAVEEIVNPDLHELYSHSKADVASKTLGFEDLFASRSHLSFPVRYQLEACLSNGYLRENNLTVECLEKLASLEDQDAVDILQKVYDKQQVIFNPMDIFHFQVFHRQRTRVPEHCIIQRSVVVTPTMIHVAPPQVEISNRLTRTYAAYADHFIRVKFADEKNEGPLRNLPNNRAEALFRRVRHALKCGVVVAGRTYYFLAFGNSQLREHGAYFYAPTSSRSAEDIRRSLGQFDHIKTVAKFGARLGQCFSTTRAMGIAAKVVDIPDIKRNGYCFTDGVGKISPFLAQMAAQELGLPNPFNDPPSLYQFRLGGCKGVLVLDPCLSNAMEAHIRPSQQKFEANCKRLEIVRSSAFAIPFLNRQIIIVLSSLGVLADVFLRKQENMINDFKLVLTNESVAVAKLRTQVDMNQTTLVMADMVLDGFMQHNEPFLMSLLRLWRAFNLKGLKEKARIVIEQGAFVFGCVDETATLKGHDSAIQPRYDATKEEKLATLPEIFIQIDDHERKGHYKVIEGICILARNPSLHPGDLRIVRAVNIPSLRHLKNVVVLPQNGDRDLASMCSGGDLDGDDYMVLWDKDLLPMLINELPMDFTPEAPIEKTGHITAEDIGEFFVTYIENDSLGQIAHAHLAQADRDSQGVRSEACLELARLHSQAVDYPKSGIAAIMKPELKPKMWPHFMEKKHIHPSKIYRSRLLISTLGLLYDKVQLVGFEPQWPSSFDDRILNAYDLDEDVLQKAGDIKRSYDETLKRIMAKHGIKTEFEAWSMFFLQHNHEIRDYKFAEELGRIIGALKSTFKSNCLQVAQVAGKPDWSSLGPFVAAMYTVTAREVEQARIREQPIPMISFPWLFAKELGKIAHANPRQARLQG